MAFKSITGIFASIPINIDSIYLNFRDILDFLLIIPIKFLSLTQGEIIHASIDYTSLYSTIAQVISTIIAIAFTISLFVVENGSKRYTPRIAQWFVANPITWVTYLSGIITVLTCIALQVTGFAGISLRNLVFLLFFLSLVLFSVYFFDMVTIINPLTVSKRLGEETLSFIKKGTEDASQREDRFKEAEERLQDIADVSIKTIRDNEIIASQNFIDAFFNVYYSVQPAEGLTKEKILKEIALFPQLFRTLRFAIEEHSPTRKYIIHEYIFLLQTDKYRTEIGNNYLVRELVSVWLSNIVELIIESNDFDLFKYHIHLLSLVIYSPDGSLEEIKNQLYSYGDKLNPRNRETLLEYLNRLKTFIFYLERTSLRRFEYIISLHEKYKELEQWVNLKLLEDGGGQGISDPDSEMQSPKAPSRGADAGEDQSSAVPREKEGLTIFDIHLNLNLYYFYTLICFEYFNLGASIVFRGNEGELVPSRYIKELWDHTNPPDADGHSLNVTPVIQDPQWLTYVYLFGGQEDSGWRLKSGFSNFFDDYHGKSIYITRYYLLSISRCILQEKSLLELPTVEEIATFKKDEPYRLAELYDFLRIFLGSTTDLEEQCKVLLQDYEPWNLLFNNHAEGILKLTSSWIRINRIACEKLLEEVIKVRDIELEKEEMFREEIVEGYHKSKLNPRRFFLEREFVEEFDSTKTFYPHALKFSPLEKKWFFSNNPKYTRNYFEPLGERFVLLEFSKMIKDILEDERIEKGTIDSQSPDIVLAEVERLLSVLNDPQCNNTIIIMPKWLSSSLFQYGIQDFQEIGPRVRRLKTVPVKGIESVILIQKEAGLFIPKPTEGQGRFLNIRFEEQIDDRSKVSLSITSETNLSINTPNKIKIIHFNLSSNRGEMNGNKQIERRRYTGRNSVTLYQAL